MSTLGTLVTRHLQHASNLRIRRQKIPERGQYFPISLSTYGRKGKKDEQEHWLRNSLHGWENSELGGHLKSGLDELVSSSMSMQFNLYFHKLHKRTTLRVLIPSLLASALALCGLSKNLEIRIWNNSRQPDTADRVQLLQANGIMQHPIFPVPHS